MNLNSLISNAIQLAQLQNLTLVQDSTCFFSGQSFGATKGQVLWRDRDGKLEMLTCWMEIKVAKTPSGQFGVALCPLLPTSYFRPIKLSRNVFLSEDMLNSLTSDRHAFGGDSVEFFEGVQPKFRLHESIDDQIQLLTYRSCRAVRHTVFEDHGSLALLGRAFFGINQAKYAYVDQFKCHIRTYDRMVFTKSGAYAESARSPFTVTIVPTIYIQDDRHRECFLDFLSNWRQSKYGDQITGKAGSFLIIHRLHDGELVTITSLRDRDSAFALAS